MAKPHRLLLVVATLVAVFGGLTACATQADAEPTRAPIFTESLQPYQSPIPSSTPFPLTPALTETPFPKSTPHLYQIAKGDTMGSVAFKFGISTENLMAMNPDILPYAMSVGQALVIPDGDVMPMVLPTLEPLALEFSLPDCYPTLSGGMWCFLLVQNKTDVAVESISAEIILFDTKGKSIARETAFPLVDRLPDGDAFPLLAFFDDIPANTRADGILLTAFPVPAGDEGYLSVSLRNVLTEIDWEGKSAEVSGDISVEGIASRLWIAATAYNGEGNVVGARRWESVSGETKFYLTVVSLGHAIERVELIVEAKP